MADSGPPDYPLGPLRPEVFGMFYVLLLFDVLRFRESVSHFGIVRCLI